MAIELLKDIHEYREGKRIVPGVTSIIKGAGMMEWYGDEAAMARGRAVHQMIHAWFDKDLLDDDKLAPFLIPFLEGLRLFVAETGCEPIEWERIVVDKTHGFAGTFDLRCRLRGIRLPVILDFKTGDVQAWTAIQTAAYVAADGMNPHHRCGVSLPGNGFYQIKHWGVALLVPHIRVFNAAMIVNRFKREKT